MITPAQAEAHVTVDEEAGVLILLVARAQGLLGRVMVAYRTSPVSAVGSEDYEVYQPLCISFCHHLFKHLAKMSDS